MPESRLKQRLIDLRSELSADELDDETRELIEALITDLEGVLEPDTDSGDGVSDRIRRSFARFGSRHPTLAAIVEDVVDTLSAMGI